MKPSRSIFILFMLFVVLLAQQSTAMADSMGPARDMVQVSADGRYIMVMLVNDDVYSQMSSYYIKPEHDDAIRAKYSQSGLYRNDGSTTPLWTVDWPYPFEVDISTDGQHMVQWGDIGEQGDFGMVALAFYENGKEIAKYTVNQLVEDPSTLPKTVSHYHWRQNYLLEDKIAQLNVETENGEKYVFDIRSGNILSKQLPPGTSQNSVVPWILFLVGLSIIVYAMIGFMVVKSLQKKVYTHIVKR